MKTIKESDSPTPEIDTLTKLSGFKAGNQNLIYALISEDENAADAALKEMKKSMDPNTLKIITEFCQALKSIKKSKV